MKNSSKDKRHYYDGKMYELLIDSAFRDIRETIIKKIEQDSKVIDIACGTGSLAFSLSKKCKSVTGVELSSKMIAYAQRRQKKQGIKNIHFIHCDATDLSRFRNKQFDYATISMAIHEMPPELRIKVLNEAKRVAKRVIIADYVVPQPLNFSGIIVRIAEFLAGPDHFRGFMHYQRNKGLNKLLSDCHLSIRNETMIKGNTIRVVVSK